MRPTLGLLGEMTARDMCNVDLIERRMFALATVPGVLAAIPKATADWPRRWGRPRTWNGGEPPGMTPNSRHRAEQAFGVRPIGRREEARGDRFLHGFTAVH